MNDIWDGVERFAKGMNFLYEQRAKIIHQNRVDGQNNPLTKKRKSESMKRYWANKKQVEKEAREEEFRNNMTAEEYHPSCSCHTGNPPCSYCTDRNYCEKCDEGTWDKECPSCGAVLEQSK
ncbi:MAG TPA: hypothetical protein ENH85_13330 [Candidatus Scalindua sp.]|nr:hypothetical protein [Candidatus Scalindua sp.]